MKKLAKEIKQGLEEALEHKERKRKLKVNKMKEKLTLGEWVSRNEDPSINWVYEFIDDLFRNNKHDGNCTSKTHSCNLCCLENLLRSYREYFFSKEK